MERNSSTKLCLNTMKVLAYFIKSLFRELLNKMALLKGVSLTLVEAAKFNADILESSHVFYGQKLVATAMFGTYHHLGNVNAADPNQLTYPQIISEDGQGSIPLFTDCQSRTQELQMAVIEDCCCEDRSTSEYFIANAATKENDHLLMDVKTDSECFSMSGTASLVTSEICSRNIRKYGMVLSLTRCRYTNGGFDELDKDLMGIPVDQNSI
ncbi:hypothetical protein Tco_1123240 [Tanacetum coccineum]|uniref:Uncharacterized protein n=1 Tax=Tanacetum coccineum TaxID=301880 RepID=A0ABQ5J2S9_9ASTR